MKPNTALRALRLLPLLIALVTTLTSQAQGTKVRLVLPAVSMLFAPIYVAQDAGYFREAALDVEMSMLAGPAALNALIGGSADATAIAGVIPLRAAQRGQKTLTIAGLQEKPTSEIVVSSKLADASTTAQTAIDKLKALKGKTIAVDAPNGLPHAYLRAIGRRAGLDVDKDIRLVFIAPTAMDAALSKGEVDGFVFSAPFTTEAVAHGARMWVGGPSGDFPELTPTTYNVLVTRTGFCEAQPKACEGLITALDRSFSLLANDPARSLAVLSARFDKMDPALFKAAFDAFRANMPSRAMPVDLAYERTVDEMFAPSDDKAQLKALAKTIQSNNYLPLAK